MTENKIKTLDKVLIIVGTFLAGFIVAMIIIYTVNGWNMDELIRSVLGTGVIEAVITGIITITKIFKHKEAEHDDCDND